MSIPSNCKYSEDHTWVRLVGGKVAYLGITDFAQGELGALVHIEVDTVGTNVEANKVAGTIEATKTTSELSMPVNAKVLEFNAKLSDAQGGDPSLVNSDPYGDGWILKIEVERVDDLNGLMNAASYQKQIAQ
jgi:glycine cleavage system H protein